MLPGHRAVATTGAGRARARRRARRVARRGRWYHRRWASARTSTRPASLSTLRCLETPGWLISRRSTRSPTDRSPSRSRSKMRRREGSATTTNVTDYIYPISYISVKEYMPRASGQEARSGGPRARWRSPCPVAVPVSSGARKGVEDVTTGAKGATILGVNGADRTYADASTGAFQAEGGSSSSGGSAFPPIADYAFLSDCEITCLIAPSGAVEWMCVPRPDSPSIFAAVLDRSAGNVPARALRRDGAGGPPVPARAA